MNQMKLGISIVLVSAAFACTSNQNAGTPSEPALSVKPVATERASKTLKADYIVSPDALRANETSARDAEPLGTGGTNATGAGGKASGGHAGDKTHGKDDHNTE